MSTPSPTTTLERAGERDAPLLANLLELYVHDLSPVFRIEVGPDGRFGYDRLALYWSEPERRWAFVIRRAAEIAGFAFVTRGSPASDDPEILDMAEFFVLRRHRRSAVGRDAAQMLWSRLPGAWIVRVSTGNTGAVAFWSAVIRNSTGAFTRTSRPGRPHDWLDFRFTTTSVPPAKPARDR